MFIKKTPKGTFKENLIYFGVIKKRTQKKFSIFFLKTLESFLLIFFFIGFISIYSDYSLPRISIYETSIIFIGGMLMASFGYFFETSFLMEILLAILVVPGIMLLIML